MHVEFCDVNKLLVVQNIVLYLIINIFCSLKTRKKQCVYFWKVDLKLSNRETFVTVNKSDINGWNCMTFSLKNVDNWNPVTMPLFYANDLECFSWKRAFYLR